MAFTRMDRKIALLKIGLTYPKIALACHVEQSLVGRVMSGERWMGAKARRVKRYIAKQIGVDVYEVFPDKDRIDGRRARWLKAGAAA